jgi:hypothetical protein
MDSIFWIGLAIGAVLSLLASVAANLANSRIQAWLDTGRANIGHHRKRKAIRLFNLARDLRTGDRDKVAFYAINVVRALTAVILSLVSVLATALYSEFHRIKAPIQLDEPWIAILKNLEPYIIQYTLAFFGLVGLYLFGRVLDRMRTVTSILNNFASSRSALIARFGEQSVQEEESTGDELA